MGRIIDRGDPNYYPIVTQDLNLDYKVLHLDENQKKLDAVRRKYGRGIKIEVCRPEAIFTLESLMPDVTVGEIIREFSLETRTDYFLRSRRVRAEALKKASGVLVGKL
jgi:hypothetical protein